ncbi:MAG TPA: hypothetical protein DCQ58_09405 [Saprospirales bacterium]|nr:hypothetical protein [Saprospirales bacterium]
MYNALLTLARGYKLLGYNVLKMYLFLNLKNKEMIHFLSRNQILLGVILAFVQCAELFFLQAIFFGQYLTISH